MGWYYEETTRAGLIKSLTTERRTDCKLVAWCTRGWGVLWSVWEARDGTRFVECDLIHHHDGMWGYKPMDESMGPCYYTVPLKYIDELAPQPSGGYSESWRVKVREWHARKRGEKAA